MSGKGVVEDGDDFDRHLVGGGQVSRHEEGDAVMARHVKRHSQRHVSLAGGELSEGCLHRLDGLAHRQRPAHVSVRKDT